MLNGKRQCFPFEIGKKARMSIFTNIIQHCTEVLLGAIRQEKEIKSIQIGKEEVKLSMNKLSMKS